MILDTALWYTQVWEVLTGVARILVVEDERDLNTMLCDFLRHKGYQTTSSYDGAEALQKVFADPPDLMLLDLNLPTLDGLDVARAVKGQTSIPVIIASARGEEEDRIAGLTDGADDYVVKPYSLPELALRIAAVLRRRTGGTQNDESSSIVVGDLIILPDQRAVRLEGKPVDLTATQFAILSRLASHPGRVYTRLQLLESFQEHAYEGYERSIDVHVKNIRKLIEKDPRNPRRLRTVWGVGYRMESPQ